MRFDEQFLQKAVAQALIVQGKFPDSARFSIDTRTLQPGDIFVALPGAKVDGHQFISDALARGAQGLIVAQSQLARVQALGEKALQGALIVAVQDTLEALVAMASAWRAQFSYPVVGITGSVGKTSTKEMLAAIVTAQGVQCLVSHGNQNTRVGLALNMLRMRPEHQVAIFEVGISKRGEMAVLAGLLRPTTGIITNVGHAHMEGLGSLADIAVEKRDLFKYFTEDSIGIVNGDQALLAQVAYAHPVIKFGVKTVNQVQARKVVLGKQGVSFTLKIYKERYSINLTNVHESAISITLAAAAAAHLLGVPHETIVASIQVPRTVKDRFEQRKLKHNKGIIISDCYNANPESMKAALLAFQRIDTAAQKVAVLGDMLELGPTSPFWHRQLGRFLRKVPSLRRVILVGDMVQWTRKMIPVGINVERVATWQEAASLLEQALDRDSLVLVKGSRGMKLDNLVACVSEAQESAQQPIHSIHYVERGVNA